MSLETITLEAKHREESGKNASRRLRAQGMIPATLYGGGKEAASAVIAQREFAALLRNNGRNKVITLNLDGASTPVKIVELQLDPIKGSLLHADLMRISLTEKTTFEVPIKAIGEAAGVKTFEGILDLVTKTLEVRCLPTDLPEAIEVDVTPLGIGDHLYVKDLKISDWIEVLTDAEKVVVTVIPPRVEEEAAPPVEGAAEPEVIKKGKTEEQGGE
ncbi:MAG: 50S ribosomal protein L25 [Blastocatellia bacterium]|nr:50S ribosomal protein L25 [Blastocatellia bacterium]